MRLSRRLGGLLALLTMALLLVRSGTGAPLPVAAPIVERSKQINHVILDGDCLYYTETNRKFTRIVKVDLTTGTPSDLLREDARQDNVRVVYAQLQQDADNVYVSRLRQGILQRWSIVKVPKDGSPTTEVLAEGQGVVLLGPETAASKRAVRTLFDLTRWRVIPGFLILVVGDPITLNLPADTFVGAMDLTTGLWSALIRGGFVLRQTSLLAAEDGAIFMRASLDTGASQVITMGPGDAANDFTVLFSTATREANIFQTGALDAANIYFWTKPKGSKDRLVCVPKAGGAAVELLRGRATFGIGLSTDGINLYWARKTRKLVRMPVAGGAVTQLLTKLFPTAALGGFPINGTSIFAVTKRGKRFSIIETPK